MRSFMSTRRRKAVVLVLALWIVVVLSVVASSLAFDVQVNSKLAKLQRDRLVAYELAKSAVAAGMTNLQNDTLIDYAENQNATYDALSDVWAEPGRRDKDKEVELGKGTYEIEVTDEDGRININRAGPKLLKAMLEYFGYEAPDSDDIANAIIDWRDPDDVAVGAAGEKENEHYSAMSGQKIDARTDSAGLIYQDANEEFLTAEELMDVYGITREAYYGYNPDAEEAKEEKIRDDIALGRYMANSSGKSRSKRDKKIGIKDVVTVRGTGGINVNTASEETLTIMFYAAGNCTNMDTAEAAAKSIVQFRGSNEHGRMPNPDDAFKSPNDIAKVPGVNAQMVQQLMSAQALGIALTFKSEVFRVTGIGRAGNSMRTVTAIVKRSLDVFNPDDARLVAAKGSAKLRGSFASRGGQHHNTGSKQTDNLIRLPAIRVTQWME